MARARKADRSHKKQLGQFMTPAGFARRLVADLDLHPASRVLEPSFGTGSFLLELIERFDTMLAKSIPDPSARLTHILTERLWGVELDTALYEQTLATVEDRFGALPERHNLMRNDFFAWVADLGETVLFDHVVGNPPFGGTFDRALEDGLDRRYGRRAGHKIKKETYAFFIVAATELLDEAGTCTFICSDTFRTIPTMGGLRRHLSASGSVSLETVAHFSDETDYPMVVLRWVKGSPSTVRVDGVELDMRFVAAVPTFSFGAHAMFAPYFAGATIGDYAVCTSGMTTGANKLFVRDVCTAEDGTTYVLETHEHRFVDLPVTLQGARDRARLGKISAKKVEELAAAEQAGVTYRGVRIDERTVPVRVSFPHPDYAPYNAMQSAAIVYSPWRKAIFWKDDGEAVFTFKKTGNWYLHGVGGRSYFRREGITWNLISDNIEPRYLPAGAILDSGAPCAFLRPGVDHDELYLILGWLLTDMASQILRAVLNHTRNVQSKDVERLPYPSWLTGQQKEACVIAVKALVAAAQAGRQFARTDAEITALNELYRLDSPS